MLAVAGVNTAWVEGALQDTATAVGETAAVGNAAVVVNTRAAVAPAEDRPVLLLGADVALVVVEPHSH